MFQIALISRWHNHAKENRYTDQLRNIPEAKITCVWDENEERGKAWGEEFSVDFEKDLDVLLKRDDVDGVLITSCTKDHKDLIVKAARAKKHVFTEKELCMNYEEAVEIKNAVKENGVQFGIVFPRRSNKEYLFAKKLYEEGNLGEVALMRVRNAVTCKADIAEEWFRPSPTGAGGAIRDLGCHNMDLACWVLNDEPEYINAGISERIRG